MNRFLQRAVDKLMATFVGSGVSLDERGRLLLPDGLCPDRVHRFIELVMDERFACQREALHTLFLCVGVNPATVHLLDEIIDADGTVAFASATRRTPALMAALPDFARIPARFRDFLVHDLELAAESCETLEHAVASAREAAAERLGCVADWDVILDRPAALTDLTRSWRERDRAA